MKHVSNTSSPRYPYQEISVLMTRRVLLACAGTAAAVAVAVPAVAAAQTTPVPVPPLGPPTVAQLCAATGVDLVDAYLAAVATSELVGALAPLVDITVPLDGDGVQLGADVTLDDVRARLACDTGVTTTPATPTTTAPADPDDEDEDEDAPTTTATRPLPSAPIPRIVVSDLTVTG